MAKKKVTLHPQFKIENIVASADLGVELDLYEIAKASPDVDYEPEQFPGAIYKIKEPKVALLLFKNGKIICTGAKTEAKVLGDVRGEKKIVFKYHSKSRYKKKKGHRQPHTEVEIVKI